MISLKATAAQVDLLTQKMGALLHRCGEQAQDLRAQARSLSRWRASSFRCLGGFPFFIERLLQNAQHRQVSGAPGGPLAPDDVGQNQTMAIEIQTLPSLMGPAAEALEGPHAMDGPNEIHLQSVVIANQPEQIRGWIVSSAIGYAIVRSRIHSGQNPAP